MRTLCIAAFAVSSFALARPAVACLSVMRMERESHEVTPAQRLSGRLTLAERKLNAEQSAAALRLAEAVLSDEDAGALPRARQAEAHRIAARAAFALKDSALVEKHYTAAVKLNPRLQKDYVAAQVLMSTWVRAQPVAAPAPLVVAVKKDDKETKMTAARWAALAEARYMTHDVEGARSAVREGLKESPKDEALLDLQKRIGPETTILDIFSNY